MSVDLKLATLLHERLDEIYTNAVGRFPSAMPYEQYHQSCGYLQAISQIRDSLLPELVQEIQNN